MSHHVIIVEKRKMLFVLTPRCGKVSFRWYIHMVLELCSIPVFRMKCYSGYGAVMDIWLSVICYTVLPVAHSTKCIWHMGERRHPGRRAAIARACERVRIRIHCLLLIVCTLHTSILCGMSWIFALRTEHKMHNGLSCLLVDSRQQSAWNKYT